LVHEADLVIASAEPIRSRLAQINPHVHLMPNVADTELFATALDPAVRVDPPTAELPRPRIVFVGAISAIKVDLELIRDMARLRPKWSFVLVGPVGLGDPDTDVGSVAKEPNVHLLGPRAYVDLPGVLAGADVGIIPYRDTDLTAGIFPMKVYEYLAAGLPTVATPLAALEGTEGVELAAGPEAMAATIGRLIAEDNDERRRERSHRAAGHSWTNRLREIRTLVEEVEWRR
jgi:glycosyltransferase involved in cell wall biosynthesis